MKKKQSGFNVTELIIALIILVILGAIAIPKILHLKAEEKSAVVTTKKEK